jgi:hypothetical protein
MSGSDDRREAAEQVKQAASEQEAHLKAAGAKVKAAVEWAEPFPDKRGTGLEGHLDDALAHVDAAAYDARARAQEAKSRAHARGEEEKTHLRERAAKAPEHMQDGPGKQA